MSYAESWGDILSRHVQFRCKICPDGSGGFADIVCGDAWHCDERGYPLFEERQGRSLIISRTARGEALVQQAMAARYLDAEPLDAGEIEKMQPSQARRKRLVLSRLVAMAVLGRTTPRFRGLRRLRAALSAGLWPNLRSFLGMARRLLILQP
jgi:coenzyme F420 hydrogenase subunit beta